MVLCPRQLIQSVEVFVLVIHRQLLEVASPFSVINPFNFHSLEHTLPHDLVHL